MTKLSLPIIAVSLLLSAGVFTAPSLIGSAHAQNFYTLNKGELPTNTCKVQGIILRVEQWVDEKYDGAPGFFNEAYTRVTMRVQSLETHDTFTNTQLPGCPEFEETKDETFRLCSNTKITPGQIVSAVAGQPTGASENGCLFDVKVTGSALKQGAK